MKKYISTFVFTGLFVTLIGCVGVVDRAVDSAVNRAADRTGTVVGDRIGQAAGTMILAQFPSTWTSQWTSLYTGYLFNVAFHAGSYSVVQGAYEPGEWTRWRMIENGEPTGTFIERALLARTDEDNEWWRVKYMNTETDEAIVLEGLFSPDREELLRLRGQFPGEEAKEMPVQEGTYGYAKPVQLTEESIEGATVGRESLSVPAGTFQARHVRYGTTGATFEWWLEDEVPGGMVKYLRQADTGTSDNEATAPASWVVELDAYGDDAESELQVL